MTIDQGTIDTITREIKAVGENSKVLSDNMQRELKEMRDLIDASGKKADTVAAERIDKFAASIETKHTAIETNMKVIEANLDKIDAVMKRPGSKFGGTDEDAEAKAAFEFHKALLVKNGSFPKSGSIDASAVDREGYGKFRSAFGAYIRRDEKGMGIEPLNALQTGSDPDGGYLVPTETSARIIKKVYETSPLRGIATVETISGKELEIPRDEGEFSCGWVGETETRTETNTSQFGSSKIAVHEMYAMPKATQSILEDGAFDVEGWIADKVSDKFARTETTAFFTGNGVNKPRGLLTYPAGTANAQIEQIVSGAAAAVTADGVKDLVYSLKDYYAANARFLMRRTTVRDVMKLKDTANLYLWQPSIQAGQPALLEGYPVTRAEDMPVVGAGNLPIAFGDFRQAYTIVDRLGIVLLRDPYTAKPYVIFYSRKRVGGDVVNFEAIKFQKIST